MLGTTKTKINRIQPNSSFLINYKFMIFGLKHILIIFAVQNEHEMKPSLLILTLRLPRTRNLVLKTWPFYGPGYWRWVPRTAAIHAPLCNTLSSNKLSKNSESPGSQRVKICRNINLLIISIHYWGRREFFIDYILMLFSLVV